MSWVVIMANTPSKPSLICKDGLSVLCIRKPVVYKTKWPGIPLIYDFPLMYFPFSDWKVKMAKLVMYDVYS